VIEESIGLSDLERDLLALVFGPQVDPTLREIIRSLRRGSGTVDTSLIAALAPAEERLEIVERFTRGLIVEAGLIQTTRAGEVVPTTRLLGLLRGVVALDARVARFASLERCHKDDAVGVVPDDELIALQDLVAASAKQRRCVLLVSGAGGARRLARACAASIEFAFVLRANAELLARSPAELARDLALLAREAALVGALPVIDHAHRLDPHAAGAALERVDRLVFLLADEDSLDLPGMIRYRLRRPSLLLRREAWKIELAAVGVDHVAEDLAVEFPFERDAVASAIGLAMAMKRTRSAGFEDALRRAARAQLAGDLGRYGQLVPSRARLADVVLPSELREQVEEIISAVRNRHQVMPTLRPLEKRERGRGLAALFHGPPGTGKTYTASVIANELELPLYRIDVSTIVDKFVGETEKNLARLFAEAENDQAILLFDEADSLFTRRVAVRDASDRASNMQVNLLLQLIEDYDGFVILTTNLKTGIDSAFLRRIAYRIGFELPEVDERAALWSAHLPACSETMDLDVTRLAQSQASGGQIKNAVLRAALASGGTLTQRALERALAAELESSGTVVRR
jgi:hypothetical protein